MVEIFCWEDTSVYLPSLCSAVCWRGANKDEMCSWQKLGSWTYFTSSSFDMLISQTMLSGRTWNFRLVKGAIWKCDHWHARQPIRQRERGRKALVYQHEIKLQNSSLTFPQRLNPRFSLSSLVTLLKHCFVHDITPHLDAHSFPSLRLTHTHLRLARCS